MVVCEALFEIKLNDFFGYFDPINTFFLIIYINSFRGDLADISDKKVSLIVVCVLSIHEVAGLTPSSSILY